MSALKPCLDCGTLSNGSRCSRCSKAKEQARDAARAPRRAGRYGAEHQALRAAWQLRIDENEGVFCRRGIEGCLWYRRGGGTAALLVRPGDAWDLGHPDALCSRPTAPEHERCNRHYAGVLS